MISLNMRNWVGVWKTVNARMYVCNAAAPLNGGLMPRCAVPLLRNILESADAAIEKVTPAADLVSDMILISFVCLL